MEVFELDKSDFIELNKLLKIMNLAASGGEANQLISEGYVQVNGLIETQKRKKLRQGDTVEVDSSIVEIK